MRFERGTVSVELAAGLPLVALALLLVAQVGLVAGVQLSLQHGAREGARAAAVWNDDERAREAALASVALDPSRTEVTVEPAERAPGDPVTVTVRARVPGLPIGPWRREAELRASATMRTERARDP